MRKHHDGSEVVCGWAAEEATYPAFDAANFGTAPDPFAFFTFADKPTVTKNGAKEPGFGAGAAEALYDLLPQKYCDISGAVRFGSGAFFQACNRGSGGYKDLADLALYIGKSNANSDGAGEVHRFAKCAGYDLVLAQDREIMFTPRFRTLGWPEAPGSLLSPDYAALAGSVNPLQWPNVTSITINSNQYRDVITGVSIQVDHGLTADNTRPVASGGDHMPISRGALLLKPGHLRIQGTLNLNTALDAAEINFATASINWDDVVLTAGDSRLGGSTSFVWTLGGCRPRQVTQQGGEAAGQVTYQVPFFAKSITLAYS